MALHESIFFLMFNFQRVLKNIVMFCLLKGFVPFLERNPLKDIVRAYGQI